MRPEPPTSPAMTPAGRTLGLRGCARRALVPADPVLDPEPLSSGW